MKPVLRGLFARLLFVPIALFIVVTLSFGLVNLAPGDPAKVIAGGLAGPEQIAQIRAQLGLDQPLSERYWTYLQGLAHGDLGTSYVSQRPVSEAILQRLPNTLELVFMALLVAFIYGLVIGGISAYFRSRPAEKFARVMIAASQSLPDFFLGLGLIFVLYYVLGWAPVPVGQLGFLDTPPPRITGALITDSLLSGNFSTAWIALQHSVIPVLALGIFYSAYIAKTAQAALGPAFSSRQVEFARACGLSEWKVVGYAVRQARTPIVTYGAILFTTLIGGSAIIETIFAWDGLGQWAIERILDLDVPAIQGFILVTGLITLATFLVLDVVVTLLDPRIPWTR